VRSLSESPRGSGKKWENICGVAFSPGYSGGAAEEGELTMGIDPPKSGETAEEEWRRLRTEFNNGPLRDKHFPCSKCCGTSFHIIIPAFEDGFVPSVGPERQISYVLVCLNEKCGARHYFTNQTVTLDGVLTSEVKRSLHLSRKSQALRANIASQEKLRDVHISDVRDFSLKEITEEEFLRGEAKLKP
jgi:hypothetical protein